MHGACEVLQVVLCPRQRKAWAGVVPTRVALRREQGTGHGQSALAGQRPRPGPGLLGRHHTLQGLDSSTQLSAALCRAARQPAPCPAHRRPLGKHPSGPASPEPTCRMAESMEDVWTRMPENDTSNLGAGGGRVRDVCLSERQHVSHTAAVSTKLVPKKAPLSCLHKRGSTRPGMPQWAAGAPPTVQ